MTLDEALMAYFGIQAALRVLVAAPAGEPQEVDVPDVVFTVSVKGRRRRIRLTAVIAQAED
jgi:hypothetical protein